MKKIRTMVVDDEPLAREGIAVLLRDESEFELIGACEDGRSALVQIRLQHPDLLFLDVQMPWFGGLDVITKVPANERPAVIFVTAYDRYAVQAFELNAVDYLLKPFRDDRFRVALDRAKEQVQRARLGEKNKRISEFVDYLRRMDEEIGTGNSLPHRETRGGGRLVFKVGGDHVFIEMNDITWIEAQGEFIKLCAAGTTHVIRESLQAVEKRLDAAVFVRTHRSFIVNVGCVRKISPTMYGDFDVVMTDGAKLRLSRTFRDRLQILLAAGTAPRG